MLDIFDHKVLKQKTKAMSSLAALIMDTRHITWVRHHLALDQTPLTDITLTLKSTKNSLPNFFIIFIGKNALGETINFFLYDTDQ